MLCPQSSERRWTAVQGAKGCLMKNWLQYLSLVLVSVFFQSPAISEIKPSDGSAHPIQYSLTKGQVIPIPAKRVILPLIVYGDDAGQAGTFVPSGYMGDAGAVEIKSMEDSVDLKSGAPGVHCLQVSYLSDKRLRSKSKGDGWAGVYWQTPANNWAKVKGAGYDLSEAKKITFWLRGEKGGETVAELKIGGLMGPYPDTDLNAIGPVKLSKEWKQYEIPLEGKDLRHISGGFAFSVRRADNPHGLVFYIDEVMYEGDSSAPAPQTSLSTPIDDKTRQAALLSKIPTEMLTETRKFTIPFQGNESSITDTHAQLDSVVTQCLKFISAKILIEGHTDSIGAAETNKKLSLERAKAVAEYLESKGIDKKRITAEGHGEDQPLVPETSESETNRASNRRVEITLAPN